MKDHIKSVSDEVIQERLKRIKLMIEHNFSETLIMEIYELDESEFNWYYEKLYPFGRFTGPFGPYMEKDIKGRFLKLAGYSEKESYKIIEENPICFPSHVENRLNEMFRKEIDKEKSVE